MNIDLKWSCWSIWRSHWEDYAPGIWDHLAGLKPGESATIYTAPRKEIRYGRVTISRLFPSMWIAEGCFTCGWDDEGDLADTVGYDLDEDGYDAFHESVPFSMHTYDPGIDVDFELKANTFEKLMRRIDRQEAQCIETSNEEWDLFEKCYS
jgi:hypothetical protein